MFSNRQEFNRSAFNLRTPFKVAPAGCVLSISAPFENLI